MRSRLTLQSTKQYKYWSGMEFWINKCTRLIIKKGITLRNEGI